MGIREKLVLKTSVKIHGHDVYGIEVNEKTGCQHYASALDVIAIKFKCCKQYYACYDCHLALADDVAEQWQPKDFDTKAILCGHCGFEMSIRQYLTCNSECSNCKAHFNPKCKLHWDLYFA